MADPGSGAPLSFGQEGLWYLALRGGGSSYHRPVRALLRGPLDVAALERALAGIARRHDILRTTYHQSRGVPYQRAGETAPPLRVIDGPLGDGELESLLAAELEAPFDLEREVLRWTLVARAPELHELAVTVHHIAFDGSSETLFMDELAAGYAAEREGRACPLERPPLQYADVARAQRAEAATFAPALATWRRLLAGASGTLPPGGDGAGLGVRSLALAPAERVGALARQHRATPFIVLAAAFAGALRDHVGRDDLTIGTAVANRARQGHARLIGLFANLLPLRIDLSGPGDVAARVGRVRAVALDAYDRQAVPFPLVVQAIERRRAPLIEAAIVLQPPRREAWRAGDLEITRRRGASRHPKFPLVLDVERMGTEYVGTFEWDRARLGDAAIQAIASHLRADLV